MKVLIILCSAFVGLASCGNRDIMFVKIGTFTGKNSQGISLTKNYYAPKSLRGPWDRARDLCQSYNMDLARLETNEEHTAVREFCRGTMKQQGLTTGNINVDGASPSLLSVKATSTDWYFEDGSKFGYAMGWAPNGPDQVHEKCLALIEYFDYLYNDVPCWGTPADSTFICQELVAF